MKTEENSVAYKKIAEHPVSMVVISSVLVFLSSLLAFFFLRHGFFDKNSVAFSLIIALSADVCMFVLPALEIKFVFRKKLEDFGVCLPKERSRAIKLTLLTLAVFVPILFLLGMLPSFQKYYTIDHSLGGFFFVEVLASALYFFAEEFMFRGFLFFGLWEKLRIHTFWVTNLLFALFHLSKPSGEVLFAFFVGLALSNLSYRTKSILPAVSVHFILAAVLNVIIYFHV